MKPEELDSLIDKLVLVSNLDGVLSDDEQKIIDVVQTHVNEFKKAYQEAWADNSITDADKIHLRNLWKNIMLETTKTAIKDQSYSKDELSLVFRIFSTLIEGLE